MVLLWLAVITYYTLDGPKLLVEFDPTLVIIRCSVWESTKGYIEFIRLLFLTLFTLS
jgi:hypothetical protein